MAALSSPSLPEALLHHASRTPDEPWLFAASGWDWRWRSFAEAAAQIARWTEQLEALPEGTVAAFAGVPTVRAWLVDLAIQAAGLVSAPVTETAAISAMGAWVEVEGDPPPILEEDETLPTTVRLPPDVQPLARGGGSAVPPAVSSERPAGRVLVREGDGFTPLSQDHLAARADALASLLPPSFGRREIVAHGRPLGDPVGRSLAAWAIRSGAAVVLEPDPASLVPTAVWARPTLFAGDAAELVRFRAAVLRASGRFHRKGLPFGRLHTVLVAGEAPLPAEETAYWQGRGVRVAPFPRVV